MAFEVGDRVRFHAQTIDGVKLFIGVVILGDDDSENIKVACMHRKLLTNYEFSIPEYDTYIVSKSVVHLVKKKGQK